MLQQTNHDSPSSWSNWGDGADGQINGQAQEGTANGEHWDESGANNEFDKPYEHAFKSEWHGRAGHSGDDWGDEGGQWFYMGRVYGPNQVPASLAHDPRFEGFEIIPDDEAPTVKEAMLQNEAPEPAPISAKLPLPDLIAVGEDVGFGEQAVGISEADNESEYPLYSARSGRSSVGSGGSERSGVLEYDDMGNYGDDEVDPVPPVRSFEEWDAYVDTESGYEYYYNRETEETTWEAPHLELLAPAARILKQASLIMTNPYRPGVPHPVSAYLVESDAGDDAEPNPSDPKGVVADWHVYLDPSTLQLYYTHQQGGVSSWEAPKGWRQDMAMQPPLAAFCILPDEQSDWWFRLNVGQGNDLAEQFASAISIQYSTVWLAYRDVASMTQYFVIGQPKKGNKLIAAVRYL